MIDRQARDAFADILEQYYLSKITNDEYDEKAQDICFGSNESELLEIYRLIWHFYDDLSTHYIDEREPLTSEQKELIKRTILFLHSPLPYQWKPNGCLTELWNAFLAAISLGVIPIIQRKLYNKRVAQNRKWDFWPFSSTEEYERFTQYPHRDQSETLR